MRKWLTVAALVFWLGVWGLGLVSVYAFVLDCYAGRYAALIRPERPTRPYIADGADRTNTDALLETLEERR